MSTANPNLLAAADAIKRAARQYEQFIEAAEFLETIGSIEQAASDARRRTDEARAAAAVAEQSVQEITARIEQLKAEAAGILDAARKEASGIVAQANRESQKIVATANSDASVIIGDANTDSKRIANWAETARVTAAEVQRVAADTLKQTRDSIEAATSDLAAINDRIAGAKAEIKRLLAPEGSPS